LPKWQDRCYRASLKLCSNYLFPFFLVLCSFYHKIVGLLDVLCFTCRLCYFAFTDCAIITLLHLLHCTDIQLFGYLYSRKCAKYISHFVVLGLNATLKLIRSLSSLYTIMHTASLHICRKSSLFVGRSD